MRVVRAFFLDNSPVIGRRATADAEVVGVFQTPRILLVEDALEGGSGMDPSSMELEAKVAADLLVAISVSTDESVSTDSCVPSCATALNAIRWWKGTVRSELVDILHR